MSGDPICECMECVGARRWIVEKTGIGGGPRPLSFLIASHEQHERELAGAMSKDLQVHAKALAVEFFPEPSRLTLEIVSKHLAAAEERGRRRGLEELDELRALLREWLPGLCAEKPWPKLGSPQTCGKCLGCRTWTAIELRHTDSDDCECRACCDKWLEETARAAHDAALAPRDSGPHEHERGCVLGRVCANGCPCWCHATPLNVAPRDSGKVET